MIANLCTRETKMTAHCNPKQLFQQCILRVGGGVKGVIVCDMYYVMYTVDLVHPAVAPFLAVPRLVQFAELHVCELQSIT